jgi:hypothetical protein
MCIYHITDHPPSFRLFPYSGPRHVQKHLSSDSASFHYNHPNHSPSFTGASPSKWMNLWVLCILGSTTDRPPARTNRPDDADASPHYEGEAGPSYLASALVPRRSKSAMPHPLFADVFPFVVFSRLPTFLKSEQEIFIPNTEDDDAAPHDFNHMIKDAPRWTITTTRNTLLR